MTHIILWSLTYYHSKRFRPVGHYNYTSGKLLFGGLKFALKYTMEIPELLFCYQHVVENE